MSLEQADDESWDEMSLEDDGEAIRGPWAFGGRPNIGRGVQTATLNTPQGSATLRLPSQVVTQDTFRSAMQRLENAISGASTNLRNIQRGTTSALARARRNAQSQAMMGMLTTMLMQRDVQAKIEDHRHLGTGVVDPASVSSDDNSMLLMMLPMMMWGDDAGASSKSEAGGSNMMMMMLMMVMMNRDHTGVGARR